VFMFNERIWSAISFRTAMFILNVNVPLLCFVCLSLLATGDAQKNDSEIVAAAVAVANNASDVSFNKTLVVKPTFWRNSVHLNAGFVSRLIVVITVVFVILTLLTLLRMYNRRRSLPKRPYGALSTGFENEKQIISIVDEYEDEDEDELVFDSSHHKLINKANN